MKGSTEGQKAHFGVGSYDGDAVSGGDISCIFYILLDHTKP